MAAALRTREHNIGQQLHHSHAHEEGLPGTVNLNTAEGDDVAYGQALFPAPALDPNDPLQWPNSKKVMILVVCALYSFLGNSALIGVSPYFALWSEIFGITETQASNLISYPNLCYGFGSLFLIPLYLKFGRRPVMLGSMLFFICGLIGTSQATTFGGLMAARCVAAFGSGVCEALPVQLVNDIFFLHERGKRIGYYTAAICFAAISPLPAAYMLTGGYSWRLYFYVILAFSIGLFIFSFLVVEETSYDRKAAIAAADAYQEPVETEREKASANQADATENSDGSNGYIPPRKSFLQTLSLKGRFDPNVPFFMTMIRSFSYFLVPQALWVMTSFGIFIGLGAFVMNFISPTVLVQPPYNWPITNTGLVALGVFLGYATAVPFSSSSDRLAARLTRKNGNIREAEMRLGVLLVPMLIGPAGLMVYGFTAQRRLHWIGFFIGEFLVGWSSYFYFSFTIAYAVDSYFANTSEMLIALNIGKQSISFGFGFAVLNWVIEYGYVVVVAGIFTGVLLANNLMVIVFMIWGKRIRRFMSTTWLARLHHQSAGEVMAH